LDQQVSGLVDLVQRDKAATSFSQVMRYLVEQKKICSLIENWVASALCRVLQLKGKTGMR